MTAKNRWRFVMSAVALAVYMICVELRAYPQQIALLVSFSTVALAYSMRRTFYELRRIYRSEASWERDETPGGEPSPDAADRQADPTS